MENVQEHRALPERLGVTKKVVLESRDEPLAPTPMLFDPDIVRTRLSGIREARPLCSVTSSQVGTAKKNPSYHRPHRSMGDYLGQSMGADAFMDASSMKSGSSNATRGRPKVGHRSSSQITVAGEAGTPMDAWSPGSTVRSTPAFDFQQASPARYLGSVRGNVETRSMIVVSDARANNYRYGPNTPPPIKRRVMRLLGRRSSSKIGSVNESPSAHRLNRHSINDVGPPLSVSSRIYNDDSRNVNNKVTLKVIPPVAAAPAEPREDAVPADLSRSKMTSSRSAPPLSDASPLAPVDDADINKNDCTGHETPSHSPVATAVVGAAIETPRVEGDVEEGGIAPTTTAPTVRVTESPFWATAAVSGETVVLDAASVANSAAPADYDLVLPSCWPFIDASSQTPVDDAGINMDGRRGHETPSHIPVAATIVRGAIKRISVEGDVEEGGMALATSATTVRVAESPFWATAAVSGATLAAKAAAVENPAAPADHGLVLPCAPTDEEKRCYYKTGRFFLVSCGLISFCTLAFGLWLFTISSPYFFWFGAPTMFLMFYLVFHYFVVAMWGRDFEPEEHAEIVQSATDQQYLPTVDVFLPVCNEPLMLLDNTWKYVSMLDYPHFIVHVLDDGAKDDVRDLAAAHGFQYIRRDDRPAMKKAGNLRYAFARTSGEAIVILDADFCPRSDFIRETVPYFLDPAIGILQTPQFFRYREEQTWIEQGAGTSQEFFYRLVQMNQDRFSGAVCVGSCGLYRRSAVEPFGGVAPISHSEDMYTGFRMTELGHKIKYLPLCLAMGICPDEPRSFFMQQYRWCMGSATLVFEDGFWSANISLIHKICFLNGLLYYFSTAIILFMSPMPIVLLVWFKPSWVLWFHSGFAVPSILMAGLAVPWWAKQKYGFACHRTRVIVCYAHLFALKDRVMGTAAAWVPSGGGASRSSSGSYESSVWLMLAWTTFCTVAIIAGSAWRMMEYPWYNYLPAIMLALGNCFLNVSTLWY